MRAQSRNSSACRVRADGVDAPSTSVAGNVVQHVMTIILGLAGLPVQAPSDM